MAETASEAMERASKVAIRAVEDVSDLKAAGDLEPGEYVRAAGEWFRVELVTQAGDLILIGLDGHRLMYAVADGERFVWHPGPFS